VPVAVCRYGLSPRCPGAAGWWGGLAFTRYSFTSHKSSRLTFSLFEARISRSFMPRAHLGGRHLHNCPSSHCCATYYCTTTTTCTGIGQCKTKRTPQSTFRVRTPYTTHHIYTYTHTHTQNIGVLTVHTIYHMTYDICICAYMIMISQYYVVFIIKRPISYQYVQYVQLVSNEKYRYRVYVYSGGGSHSHVLTCKHTHILHINHPLK